MKQIFKKNETYACGWLFLIVVAVLCLLSDSTIAQVKNYNVWLLNSGDLIDFNSGEAVVGKAVDDKLNLNYGILSLSDDEGNVALFGSATIKDDDGNTVWNPKGLVYGYFGVRDPSLPDSYYIMCSMNDGLHDCGRFFCLNRIYKDNSGRFVTTEITRQCGQGGLAGFVDGMYVVFVASDVSSGILSVFVVHDGNIDCVNTIDAMERLSSTKFSCMRFNADFTRLYAKTDNGLCVYDFDFEARTLGECHLVDFDKLKAFDFSENGEYIYFLQGTRGNYTISRCLEADILSSTNIEIVATLINKWGNYSTDVADLQLAPDGNIYIGIYRWDKLSYITETDGECVFHEDEIELSNPFGGRFPKMPRYQSSFKISKCSPDVAPEYRGYPYDGISWDFGDGTPVVKDGHPVHHYGQPGKYTVTMTVVFKNGIEKEVKKNVYVMKSTSPRIIIEEDF